MSKIWNRLIREATASEKVQTDKDALFLFLLLLGLWYLDWIFCLLHLFVSSFSILHDLISIFNMIDTVLAGSCWVKILFWVIKTYFFLALWKVEVLTHTFVEMEGLADGSID